ncbi:MAG TPA: DUF721 domain-containing protein [Verrucomicrobiae bacterium]|jgi:hypothetical protein
MERSRHFRQPRMPLPPPTPRQRALAQWRGWDWTAEEKARQPSAKSAGGVLPRVLTGLDLERRRAEMEIIKFWSLRMDPNVTAHARPTGLRRGTLFVSVDSNVWLDEIVRYRRKKILEMLQDGFGRTLVAKISFRCG